VLRKVKKTRWYKRLYVLCWRLFCRKMATLHSVWTLSLNCQVCWWQFIRLSMHVVETWELLNNTCLFNLVLILTSCSLVGILKQLFGYQPSRLNFLVHTFSSWDSKIMTKHKMWFELDLHHTFVLYDHKRVLHRRILLVSSLAHPPSDT
jgi:hypothetical protein